MKAKLTFLFSLLVVASQFAPIALAQSPSDKPARHVNAKKEHHARWASLTEEERAKIRAAHQKAMSDPFVKAAHERLKQARKEFREVMRPAMVRADPSIQPLLEKLCPECPAGE